MKNTLKIELSDVSWPSQVKRRGSQFITFPFTVQRKLEIDVSIFENCSSLSSSHLMWVNGKVKNDTKKNLTLSLMKGEK
jgi:hypothetical protein